MQDIIAKLTAKDDKYACVIADKSSPKVKIRMNGMSTSTPLLPYLIIQSHL